MTHLGLNDISLTQMPQDIGKLRSLRSLEVRENLLRSIPASISQLLQLQRLDLGHNELDDLVSFNFSDEKLLTSQVFKGIYQFFTFSLRRLVFSQVCKSSMWTKMI